MAAASIKENGHLLAPEQNGGAPQHSTSASLLQLSQQSQRQYSLSSLHRSAATSTSVSACPQSMAAVGATFGSPIHQLVQLSPSHGACRYALASTNPNASPLCGIPTDTVDVDVGVGMASMALASEDMRAVPVSYCSLHDPTAAGSYVGYDLSGAGGGPDLTLAPLAYQTPPPQFVGGACSCCLIDPQANGGYYPQATVLTNGGGIMCQPIPEEAHGDECAHTYYIIFKYI